ncbi:MAG TPA: MFS transporter [Candidatus Eisenbacteria bacterium]|nr:MFS transporter [Candidatus Eisenbacteria bacterium]
MGPRLVLFLTVFIHLLGFGLLLPVLPYYAKTYGAGGLIVGLLSASFSFFQFLFAPVWGRLSDRVGRRPILLGSLLVTSASYLVFGFAHSLWLLFASRILAGIAGAVLPTAQTYIADTTSPEERTKGMGMIGAALGLGFTFGPAIGGALSHWGYSVPAFASAGFALLAAVLAFFLLPESLSPESRAEAAARRLARPGLAVAFSDAFAHASVRPVLILYFVGTLCFAGLEATFALFGHDRYGLTAMNVGYLLGYMGILAVLMQGGLVGRLARKFGEPTLVRSGFLLLAAGMLAAGVAPPFSWLLVALAAVALGNGLASPSLAGLVSIATIAAEQGSVLGVYQALGSLARTIGPFLGGLAFDTLGPTSPLWIGGAILGLASFLAGSLPRRAKAAASAAPAGPAPVAEP